MRLEVRSFARPDLGEAEVAFMELPRGLSKFLITHDQIRLKTASIYP